MNREIKSDHAKEAMLDMIEQDLLEVIADFLDSDCVQLNEAIGLFYDPISRDKSELHIRMAKAAMKEYRNTVAYKGLK